MIIESGVIIFIGLLFFFIKMPRRMALRLLGNPLLLDNAAGSTTSVCRNWLTHVNLDAFRGPTREEVRVTTAC